MLPIEALVHVTLPMFSIYECVFGWSNRLYEYYLLIPMQHISILRICSRFCSRITHANDHVQRLKVPFESARDHCVYEVWRLHQIKLSHQGPAAPVCGSVQRCNFTCLLYLSIICGGGGLKYNLNWLLVFYLITFLKNKQYSLQFYFNLKSTLHFYLIYAY